MTLLIQHVQEEATSRNLRGTLGFLAGVHQRSRILAFSWDDSESRSNQIVSHASTTKQLK